MLPTLAAGDLVLIEPLADATKLLPGDIVVVRHPYQRNLLIVKRIAEVTPEDRLVVASDNPQAGSDSRQFGSLATDRLIGRVTSHVPKP